MNLKITKSALQGSILIPASKSHTIRAIAIAAMAKGTSVLKNPLFSADAISCMEAAQKMGATIKKERDKLVITGIDGKISPLCDLIDVGNSGTTLRILSGLASTASHHITFDGDSSIRKRPMISLLSALQNLGVSIESTLGKCPFTIRGPLLGGKTTVDGISSQFLTALLFACPLAKNDSEITVENLHEQPYVQITLDWLKMQNIQYEHKGLDWFKIKGNQTYSSFERLIPSDFSSATFALCAAAITGSEICIQGLDFNDAQGDKEVFTYLEKMGVTITHQPDGVWVKGNKLKGIDIDMNCTPDALPALAVTACFAEGTTRLLNVKQARLKECDRIMACAKELTKMGADIEELPDGMIIKGNKLTAAALHGYNDHRMVMALSLAGMALEGITTIDTAESIKITYPGFVDDMKNLGANIHFENKS